MKEVDFATCRFINEKMCFLTYYDFYANRKTIKEMFENLNPDGKLFYMWYLYANIHMNETYKNICWDYLNNYADDCDLAYKLRFYRAR